MKVITFLIIFSITSCSLNQRLEIKSLSNHDKDGAKIEKLNSFIFDIHNLLIKKKYLEIAEKHAQDPLVYDASFVVKKSEMENLIKEYFESIKNENGGNELKDQIMHYNRTNQLLDCKISIYDNCAIMSNKSKNMEIKLKYFNKTQKWKITMLNTFPFHESLDPNQW